MGGFARGETAFDCCDSCAGSGRRLCYRCPVDLLGVPCGEHVLPSLVRHDVPITRYRCLNGHRWDYSRVMAAWVRLEDVAAAEAVAS